VPTATDLAFGIKFVNDRVRKAGSDPLECHSAHSLQDFATLPVRNFHMAMVQCFASGGRNFYSGHLLGPPEETGKQVTVDGRTVSAEENFCANLSLTQPDIVVPPADFQPFVPIQTSPEANP
jgi:hypothetical protein